MKLFKRTLIIGGLIVANQLTAQIDKTVSVLNIDVRGDQNLVKSKPGAAASGDITRRELSKINMYQVSYHQDNEKIIKDNNIDLNNCYDKTCLVNTGKLLGSDFILSGYIEYTNDNIAISYRQIEISTKKTVKSITKEYQYLPGQLKSMIVVTLNEMYGVPVDETLNTLLTKETSRDGFVNNNGNNRLNLSGTRMGFVTILGDNRNIIKAPRDEGGMDANPTLFQFGYQFEKMYLNNGRVQGLFEFIPTLTGLEQGLFLPSATVMHGIRDNKTGFEIAFGPTVGLIKKADGYYDDGQWRLESEWTDTTQLNPNSIVRRMDSRGKIELNPGFVFAVGYTIKSGNLNIPINAFTVMQKRSFRVGVSIGLNSKK